MSNNSSFRNSITGYHANYEAKCKNFIENDKMIISEDTTFLGRGMYFWDNQFNSKWWKAEKERKNPNKTTIIVQARIDIENMLDLTDEEVVCSIVKLWTKYLKKRSTSGKYTNKDREKLGLALDMLPDVNKIPVRKASLKYKGQDNILSCSFYQGSKGCNFSTKNRIIYMVKEKECIIEKSYLDG